MCPAWWNNITCFQSKSTCQERENALETLNSKVKSNYCSVKFIFSAVLLLKPQPTVKPLYQTALLTCYLYWTSWLNALFNIIFHSILMDTRSFKWCFVILPCKSSKRPSSRETSRGPVWQALHIILHLPNWRANSIIHVRDREAIFQVFFCFKTKCWYYFYSLKIKILKLGHRDEGLSHLALSCQSVCI